MVRLLALAAVTVTTLVTSFAATEATFVVNWPKGQYYRPFGLEVSGRVDANTLYTRSPCPALNSMANHGFIPRDGKNLTREMLKAAVMEYFNIDSGLADIMVSLSPDLPTFSLATLSTHNLIEHDVSLSRRDSYFGADQSVADNWYVNDMLNYGLLDGVISLADLAKIRVSRFKDCTAKNPKCDYGALQQFIANAESGLLLRGLGGKNTEGASYSNVYSFFVNERFPLGFTKSPTPITFSDVTVSIANLVSLQL